MFIGNVIGLWLNINKFFRLDATYNINLPYDWWK
jgi:hypothetical protein